MAVYTHVSEGELTALLERYRLGEALSFKGIAEGVENSNFYLATEKGRYILTLYEKRVDAGDLPFFLGLMEHLAARGLPCPLPVHDENGTALQQVAGRNAALISFLDGVSLENIEPPHCDAVGKVLAEMHLAGHDFGMKRPNALSLKGWRALVDQHAAQADEVEDGLSGLITGEMTILERNWPGDLPEGVIHADLFTDNVLFLHGKLSGVIDFYFACNDAFAYDLAICLNAWCFDAGHNYIPALGDALIRGYQGGRQLNERERDALPLLCRGAALRFLLTRLHDWLTPTPGAIVRPKDPLDYAKRLHFWRGAPKSVFGL